MVAAEPWEGYLNILWPVAIVWYNIYHDQWNPWIWVPSYLISFEMGCMVRYKVIWDSVLPNQSYAHDPIAYISFYFFNIKDTYLKIL